MIRLDATTRKLQIILGGVVTTNQLPVSVSYSDKTTTTYTGAMQLANTNSTTAVDICAAPAASTIRDVDYISVHNSDTAAATITIRYNDNATIYNIATTTLAVGDQLVFVHGSGWHVIDSTGKTKVTSDTLSLTASNITNVAAGGISAVNVQTALNELDTEKAPLASPTFTGVVAIQAGAAAAPALTPTGDVNTGMWFPAADTIAWSTAGAERLRIDSAGKVTIQTLTIGLGASAISTNTAIGASALAGNTTGANSVAVGYLSLSNTTTGGNNNGCGFRTLYSTTTGGNNNAQGADALYNNTTGSHNTAIGDSALYSNTTGDYNTAIGRLSGYSGGVALQTHSYCLYLGQSARADADGYTNSIALGSNAVITASNQIMLGDTAVTSIVPGGNGVAALGSAAKSLKQVYFDYTNTATVGAVTINKAAGRVNIAAAGTSVVVTNSLVTAASHVLAVISTNDTTARVTAVVPAAGSFTIYTVATTAQTSFDFFVVNAD